jgi:hypothetical protein
MVIINYFYRLWSSLLYWLYDCTQKIKCIIYQFGTSCLKTCGSCFLD